MAKLKNLLYEEYCRSDCMRQTVNNLKTYPLTQYWWFFPNQSNLKIAESLNISYWRQISAENCIAHPENCQTFAKKISEVLMLLRPKQTEVNLM